MTEDTVIASINRDFFVSQITYGDILRTINEDDPSAPLIYSEIVSILDNEENCQRHEYDFITGEKIPWLAIEALLEKQLEKEELPF